MAQPKTPFELKLMIHQATQDLFSIRSTLIIQEIIRYVMMMYQRIDNASTAEECLQIEEDIQHLFCEIRDIRLMESYFADVAVYGWIP